MTKEDFRTQAAQHGFARVAFVGVEEFSGYKEAANRLRQPPKVVESVVEILQGAKSVAVLVFPYAPIEDSEGVLPISGYNVASNSAFFALNALLEDVSLYFGHGRFFNGTQLPAKRAMERAFPGCRGRNGLVGLEEFGTRICLQLLVNDVFEPDVPEPQDTPCRNCTLCAKACPAGAIGDQLGGIGDQLGGLNGLNLHDVLDANRCIRSFMDGGIMPDWVKERMPALLGCEVCQAVCTRNAHVKASKQTPEIRAAFAYEALLDPAYNYNEARAIVGRNISKTRLLSQAIVLAARVGGYEALIAGHLGDLGGAVGDAVLWGLGYGGRAF